MERDLAAARLSEPGLLDRLAEREVLDRLLADVQSGQSGVLVIRGEPGIGKTALIRYAERQATGLRIARVGGVEAEMELPFAALHQLCAPMLARLPALPKPQQDALTVALGLASGSAPDRFLVGLAVLSLLSAVAEDQPLLCFVDDARRIAAGGCAGTTRPSDPRPTRRRRSRANRRGDPRKPARPSGAAPAQKRS